MRAEAGAPPGEANRTRYRTHRKQGTDRSRARVMLRRLEWPLVVGLAVLALVLGVVGFHRYLGAGQPGSANSLDVVYRALQLFVLESGAVGAPLPWTLQVARFLAPAVATYAAVRALALLFAERLERVRIRLQRGHVVLCGLGQKGLVLARSLRRQGERVVVVEEDAENDLIEAARAHGALVLVADARDPSVLRYVGVPRASHVVAVTGDDGDNAAIAVHVRGLVPPGRPRPLRCLAHVYQPRLCDLLRLQELVRPGEDGFRLDFFNVYVSGARALLREHPIPGLPSDAPGPTRIVLVGLGRFGESLLLQAALDWQARIEDHEETARKGGKGAAARLHVLVVDRDGVALVESLEQRNPWLAAACVLEPWAMDVESAAFARGDFLAGGGGRTGVVAAYVCLDDDSAGLVAGLTLQRQLRDTGVAVVVRMVHGAGLAVLLGEQTGGTGFQGLHAFGLLDRLWNPDLLFAGDYERIARAIHERYVRQCRATADHEDDCGDSDQTDDPALRPWDELDEGLRESSRAQAAHIGTKLAAVDCELAPLTDPAAPRFRFNETEVERLARMEHERWCAERRSQGWSMGPRDLRARTTPYLVPWEELDELDKHARDRDRVFVRELPAFLAEVGFRVVRRAPPADEGAPGDAEQGS